jgi:hypothetical protein
MALRYRMTLMSCLSLVLLFGLVFLQGCKKAEAKDGADGQDAAGALKAGADDPVDFFITLEDVLSENSLASIAIVEITDPINNDRHKIRNVRQATMEQLSLMLDIAVREVSEKRAALVMGDLKGTASMGLDPESVMDMGIQLNVDALLFASIESNQNDVFFKAYSTMSGDVIFSDTLQKWQLPVGGVSELDALLSGLDINPVAEETDTE